ncbi:MAG: type II toxin-antitoxin system HicA family toxin [Xanthomonadaceae bacterium]|jgi:predicted RNA binding protein YcfA (HicA-like mRNA interferase family)|nr:type II toxin-antitoxin system HicA family toxin [Xanthomonadaceae bacterium]
MLSGAEVCAILTAQGFREVRRKGSHIVMQIQVEGGTRTVVVPDHREVAIGTLASIARQAGIGREPFETP